MSLLSNMDFALQMNNTFLLFYCPKRLSQVWILVYRNWSLCRKGLWWVSRLKVPSPCDSREHHNQHEPILHCSPHFPSPPPPKKGLSCTLKNLKRLAKMQTRQNQKMLKFSWWVLDGFPCYLVSKIDSALLTKFLTFLNRTWWWVNWYDLRRSQ